ncbi:unnamed protein product [Trichobilharzia szidati]|nr:unnamed protein product [Trichobilharzia szidati]
MISGALQTFRGRPRVKYSKSAMRPKKMLAGVRYTIIVLRMSDLEEENHRLLAKMSVLERMEIAYLDEIQSLNELIACLKLKSPGEFWNIDNRQSGKLSKKNRLAEKLNAAENLETDLLQRLYASKNKVNKICMDSNTGALNEVKRLENEQSEMKITAQMNTSRLCRCIEELEEDFCCLQSYKDELKQ